MKNRRKLHQKLLCCFKCFSPHSIGKPPCKSSSSFRLPAKSNNNVEQETYCATGIVNIRSHSTNKFRPDSKHCVEKTQTSPLASVKAHGYESPMGAEEREEGIKAAIVYCKSYNESSSYEILPPPPIGGYFHQD